MDGDQKFLMSAAICILLFVSVVCWFGVSRYGWVNLLDELFCTSLALGALVLGGSGGKKRFSEVGVVFAVPVAMGVGLFVGSLFPPFSASEMVAMGVATVAMLGLGAVASS